MPVSMDNLTSYYSYINRNLVIKKDFQYSNCGCFYSSCNFCDKQIYFLITTIFVVIFLYNIFTNTI